MRVLFFGDSITWGGYDKLGGWADRLKRGAIEEFVDGEIEKHQLFNLGIGSETSAVLLKRIESEIQARLLEGKGLAVFITSGCNDSRFVGDSGTEEVPLDQYKSNLEAIIAIARKYTEQIILVGLAPIRDDNVKSGHSSFSNSRIKKYDQTLSEIAAEQRLPIVKLFEKMNQAGPANLVIKDGLHPNNAGHELIASLVKPELEKLLHN